MRAFVLFGIIAIFLAVVASQDADKRRNSPKFDRIVQMLEKRRDEAQNRVNEIRRGGDADKIAEEEKKLNTINDQIEMFKRKVEQTPNVMLKERKRAGGNEPEIGDLSDPESIKEMKEKRREAKKKMKKLKEQIHAEEPKGDL